MFNKSALQRISGRGETWMRKMPELSAAKLQLQLKHSQIFRNVHLQIFHKTKCSSLLSARQLISLT